MLEAIATILMARGLVTAQWKTDVQAQGELVKLCREYYDGFHRMQLTAEMKAMLNIADTRLERYNINYCSLIIDRMADRLTVEQFEAKSPKPESAATPTDLTPLPRGGTIIQPPPPAPTDAKVIDPAQEWVNDLMEDNRFDGLQRDVTVAYLRDGMTFVMCQYDDVEKYEYFCQEDAYDGDIGTLVIYERGSATNIAAAVKIWYDVPPTPNQQLEGETDISLYKRVNIYYPNQTDKYESRDGLSITLMDVPDEEVVTVRNGKPAGVPIVPFYNKGGVSELVNIIPLQDSLNSQLVDLVMAGRLTAFSIVLAVNLDVPQAITPGMTITKKVTFTNADGTRTAVPNTPDEASTFAAFLNSARLERLPVGDLSQIIAGMNLIISRISEISQTPLSGQMGSDASSGESLKQREIGMLGKLNRAQVQLGNAWEDVIWLANAQQALFGHATPPPIDKLDTRWKSAEMRNDTDILTLFKLLNDAGFERAALRALGQSGLASFTDEDIEKMINEKAKDVGQKMSSALSSLNRHDNFNVPTSGGAFGGQSQRLLNGQNAAAAVPV